MTGPPQQTSSAERQAGRTGTDRRRDDSRGREDAEQQTGQGRVRRDEERRKRDAPILAGASPWEQAH